MRTTFASSKEGDGIVAGRTVGTDTIATRGRMERVRARAAAFYFVTNGPARDYRYERGRWDMGAEAFAIVDEGDVVPSSSEGRPSEVRELAPAVTLAKREACPWDRLVDLWDANGYDGAPPKCMLEYVDALEEALR